MGKSSRMENSVAQVIQGTRQRTKTYKTQTKTKTTHNTEN